MKKLMMALPLLLAGFAPAAQAGNIANCEVVLMEPMATADKSSGGRFASFRPAAEFMSSVYDDKEGFAANLDGHDIRGVMCTRRDIIPTLRDFPILATGIPFSLSENFDAASSALMTIYFKDGQFQHIYKGAALSPAQAAKLNDVLEIFNLQPHKLGKGKP